MADDNAKALRLPRRDLAKVVAIAIAQAVTLVSYLWLLRTILDDLSKGQVDVRVVGKWILLLLGVAALNAVLRGVEFSMTEKMGYELVRRLRMRLYGHMQGMAPRQLQHRSRGSLLMRFTGDLSILRTWVSRGLARGLISAIVLAAGLGIIAYFDARLAVTIGAVLAFGSAALAEIGPRLNRVTRRVRRRRSLLTSNVDEQIHALAVVQVSGRSAGEYERLSRQNDALTKTLYETATTRGLMLGISSATGWLAIVAVLFVGTIEVAAGNASVGVVATAVIAARQLTGPVRRLGLSYDYWQRARVSRAKILDFMRSSTRPLDAAELEGLRVRRGRIELRDVTVAGSLAHVTQSVEGGDIVAIMGPAGAGKSSLLGAVAGLLDAESGEIVVDDQPVAGVTLRSRFRNVGVVAPDLPLMRGTVRRNLTYRQPTASDDEIRRVLLACHLDGLVDELPQGIDTWLTEGARNLSAGERQRLSLGRALMGDPPILLLDEPTANLDEASKEVFRRVIAHHNGTVLMVTHDSNEAAIADQVWTMADGRVVEAVPRAEFRDRLWATARDQGPERRELPPELREQPKPPVRHLPDPEED